MSEQRKHPTISDLAISTIGDVISVSEWPNSKKGARAKPGGLHMRLHYRSGYLCVDIHRDGKRHKCFVHKLVAETFLGLDPNGDDRVVNHKNGIRSDNRVENLELVSQSRDTIHAFETEGRKPKKWNELVDPDDGLTEAAVHLLRATRHNGLPISDELIKRLGVSRLVAINAAEMRTWTHLNTPDRPWMARKIARQTG